ncbi:MAG: hypothetical protein AAF648_16395, partial [Pseudomonadota bacterium]
AERARLSKEQQKLEKDLGRIQGKLNNQGFVAKAPAEVVEKERGKAAAIERDIASVVAQLAQLDELE